MNTRAQRVLVAVRVQIIVPSPPKECLRLAEREPVAGTDAWALSPLMRAKPAASAGVGRMHPWADYDSYWTYPRLFATPGATVET